MYECMNYGSSSRLFLLSSQVLLGLPVLYLFRLGASRLGKLVGSMLAVAGSRL